jgi:hypothetical protein
LQMYVFFSLQRNMRNQRTIGFAWRMGKDSN